MSVLVLPLHELLLGLVVHLLVHLLILRLSTPSHACAWLLLHAHHTIARWVLPWSLLLSHPHHAWLLLLSHHTRLLLHAHHARLLLHAHHWPLLLLHLLLAHHVRTPLPHATIHTVRLLLSHSTTHARLLRLLMLMLLLWLLLLWLLLLSTSNSTGTGIRGNNVILTSLDAIGPDHVVHIGVKLLDLIHVELTIVAEADQHILDSLFQCEGSHIVLLLRAVVGQDLGALVGHWLWGHVPARAIDHDIIENFLHLFFVIFRFYIIKSRLFLG